jgi:ABC-type dipeptide/oligopeptide/nickel transport system permease component
MDPILWVLFFIPAVVIYVLCGFIPGLVAQDRGHKRWKDVKALGLVGLIVPPCWVAALIWAFVGERGFARPAAPRKGGGTTAREILERARRGR